MLKRKKKNEDTYSDDADGNGLLTLDAGQKRWRNRSVAERTRSEILFGIDESFGWASDDAFNFLAIFVVDEISISRFHQNDGVLESGVFQTGPVAFDHHWRQYRHHIYHQSIQQYYSSISINQSFAKRINREMDQSTLAECLCNDSPTEFC